MNRERWKKLYQTGNPLEREVIISLLRSENVPVKEQGEALGKIYVFNAGPLAQVTLYVPESQWERARELIDTANENL